MATRGRPPYSEPVATRLLVKMPNFTAEVNMFTAWHENSFGVHCKYHLSLERGLKLCIFKGTDILSYSE